MVLTLEVMLLLLSLSAQWSSVLIVMMLAGRVDLLSTVACFPLEEIFLPPYYSTQCVAEIIFRKTVNGNDKKLYIIRITAFFRKGQLNSFGKCYISGSRCAIEMQIWLYYLSSSIEKFKNHNFHKVFDRKMFTFLGTSLVLR